MPGNLDPITVIDPTGEAYNNGRLKTEAVFADSPHLDAFSRLRVSNPQTLLDSKQIFDNQPRIWDDAEVSGSGTTSTNSQDTASSTMGVAATTAGKRVRQTFMRLNYQPGKSHLIFCTGTLEKSGGGTGIKRGFGYFDDENGIFLQDNEGTMQIVKRSHVTGSTVDTEEDQDDWNLDTMDGNGPSGITLDFSKAQILIIEMAWLGVSRVRIGFVVGGKVFYAHEFLHANINAGVYMSTPNLPIRYEIENDGSGAASTLEHICCSVISEGGRESFGVLQSIHNGTDKIDANSAGTVYALIGLRLKSDCLGATVQFRKAGILATTADNFYWEIRGNPTVSGTFNYSDVSLSCVQAALGDTSNPSNSTVTGGVILDSGYGSGNATIESKFVNSQHMEHMGAAIDGTRDTVVLCVSPLSSNLDIYGSMSWLEII